MNNICIQSHWVVSSDLLVSCYGWRNICGESQSSQWLFQRFTNSPLEIMVIVLLLCMFLLLCIKYIYRTSETKTQTERKTKIYQKLNWWIFRYLRVAFISKNIRSIIYFISEIWMRFSKLFRSTLKPIAVLNLYQWRPIFLPINQV